MFQSDVAAGRRKAGVSNKGNQQAGADNARKSAIKKRSRVKTKARRERLSLIAAPAVVGGVCPFLSCLGEVGEGAS